MKKFVACIATVALMFTATTANAEKWVGVFLPMQSPLVDQKTEGRTESQYFMDVWHSYELGRIQGAAAEVTVFLRTNRQNDIVHQGVVSGHEYFPIDRNRVTRDTMLCVQVPWTIIAHQTMAAGEHIACTPKGQVDSWFNQGRGNTADDAWGVIAIAPAGM